MVKDTNTYELVILTVERKQNSEFGKLTCFTHVRETCQILAGTNRGYALVYGYTSEFNATIQDAKDIEDMKFVKGLKIQQCRIEVINNIDGCVISLQFQIRPN